MIDINQLTLADILSIFCCNPIIFVAKFELVVSSFSLSTISINCIVDDDQKRVYFPFYLFFYPNEWSFFFILVGFA